MSSEPPKPGAIPGWGDQPTDAPATPPEPAQPAPGSGAIPGWGQQPGPGEPPAPAPATPAAPIPAAPPSPSAAPAAPGTSSGWGAGAAPPPAGPPGSVPPGTWNPAPAQSSGMSGCLKIFLVLAIVAVVGFTLFIAGILFLANRVIDSAGGVSSDGSVGAPCAFVDNATLGEVLGSGAQAIKLEGLWDATIGIIADKRVLPDAEDCWITADSSTALGRIAEYKGGDAAAVYVQERQNAQPTSQDQGGGVSLESSGYFAGDVSGLGDEAFCTGVDVAFQAGVLVRRGDTLLYVSLTGAPDAIPSLGITDPGVVTADAVCATAQEIARRILR